MASQAMSRWAGERAAALDEVEAAHRAIGGDARGRRFATQQVNYAYAVLLSSQFQGFCRDLHSECAERMAASLPAGGVQDVVLSSLTRGRKLDHGNPNVGNIGSDFAMFGVRFWDDLKTQDRRHLRRMEHLKDLNKWRNAIAHHDFSLVGSSVLHLTSVRQWRSSCGALANGFDHLMRNHIASIVGVQPWT